MTLVAVPIFVSESADVSAALDRAAAAGGADLVEWRVDGLAEADGAAGAIADLVQRSPLPCIVTCRAACEGGQGEAAHDLRGGVLAAALAADPPPRYVDLELSSVGADAGLADLAANADPDRTGIILSAHDFDGRPADLLQRIEAMTADPACAVVKIAWRARSLRDNLEAFDLLAERRKPTIALCMGPFGLPSRVLAPKFGGFVTYAADAEDEASAPGQPTIRALRDEYRFDAIGRDTRLYGVIGWPVAHSASPRVHNAAFAAAGHDGVYLPLPVPTEWEHFKATVRAMVDHPGLGFAGASVTIPHKRHLLRFVEESGGRVDDATRRAGAANTLVVGSAGALACANTDVPAAVAALCAGMEIDAAALAGMRCAVLGAGGVARAVAAGLSDAGATVVVFARRREQAVALAEELNAGAPAGAGRVVVGKPGAEGCGCFPVIVNGTPVGMEGGPDPEGTPLPDGVTFDDTVTVFETVYTPARTPLVREAEVRGARVVSGVELFLRQAMLQYELWTGEAAPEDVMRRALATP